jgi:steroid delta-isomerase-like uncharacterized protein
VTSAGGSDTPAHSCAGDLLSLFTDDVLYEDVALGIVNRSKEQLRGFVEGFVQGYPDITVELISSFASRDYGAAEWVIRGTHLGDRPGRPATGKPIELRGASIFRFAQGKIQIVWTTRIWRPCSSRSA